MLPCSAPPYLCVQANLDSASLKEADLRGATLTWVAGMRCVGALVSDWGHVIFNKILKQVISRMSLVSIFRCASASCCHLVHASLWDGLFTGAHPSFERGVTRQHAHTHAYTLAHSRWINVCSLHFARPAPLLWALQVTQGQYDAIPLDAVDRERLRLRVVAPGFDPDAVGEEIGLGVHVVAGTGGNGARLRNVPNGDIIAVMPEVGSCVVGRTCWVFVCLCLICIFIERESGKRVWGGALRSRIRFRRDVRPVDAFVVAPSG